LAPKVYGLLTENGESIIKVKGITKEVISKLSLDDLEQLLIKNSVLEFSQEKWFRDLIDGNITNKDQIYTLKVTNNKRQLIYNQQSRRIF
jgi:hypothetical protein